MMAPFELVKKNESIYISYRGYAGRFKNAEVAFPGGCDFGVRPIDQHVKGLEALGQN
jgi:UDP-N-acetylglucosamine 1-carboxyvinyltransferase